MKALGLAVALLLLGLIAGTVAAQTSDGLECVDTKHIISLTVEPYASGYDATTPEEALVHQVSEGGPDSVGLGSEPGTAESIAAAFTRSDVSDNASWFTYEDAQKNTLSRVLVEATSDGSYFVSGAQFCAPSGG